MNVYFASDFAERKVRWQFRLEIMTSSVMAQKLQAAVRLCVNWKENKTEKYIVLQTQFEFS